MPNRTQVVTGLMAEHETIKEQVRQAQEAMEDWQRTLDSAIAGGESVQIETLSAKQWRLVQAMHSLEQGLVGHYQREEQELVPLIGSLLGESLRIEHEEIERQLRLVRLLLTDTDLKALSMAELAAKYPDVKRDIERAYRLIVDHGSREDAVLRLLLRAVVDKGEDVE